MATEYMNIRLQSIETEIQKLENEKQQINAILNVSDTVSQASTDHLVALKNLGSNKYMVNSGRTAKGCKKTVALGCSDESTTKFQISEYENVFIIESGDYALEYTHPYEIKIGLNPVKHLKTHQCWALENTPKGTIIHSCRLKKSDFILVQQDDIFTCVPWNDIKDNPEKVKYAYWDITN